MLEHGQREKELPANYGKYGGCLDNFGQFCTILEFGAIYSNDKMDRFMFFPG